MFRKWRLAALLAATVVTSSASAQNTQRGAAVGGIVGAIAGGIIGDHNDKAGAGALIGGAVGAVAGGVIGNAKDKEVQYQRYQVQQQAVVTQRQAVSVTDVVQMSRSGLSDSLIINQINARGVTHRLEVPDIISLHQQGVSEVVISAMQQASVGPRATYVAPVQPAPVIVEERYRVVPTYVVPQPVYYGPPPAYYHHRHHHHW